MCDFEELEDIIASSNSGDSPPRAKTPAELDNSVEKMQTSKVETVKPTVTENKESTIESESESQSGACSVDSFQDNIESAEIDETIESPPLSISEEIIESESLTEPGSPLNDQKSEEGSKSPKLRRTLSKIDLILNSTPDELDNIDIGPPPIRNSPRPNSRPVTPRPLKPPKPSILVHSTLEIQDKPVEPVETPNSLEASPTEEVEQVADQVEKVELEIEEEVRDDNKEPVKVMCKCCYIFNCRLIDTRCRAT